MTDVVNQPQRLSAEQRAPTLAQRERTKLVRSLRRADAVALIICATVGIDTIGQTASFGFQGLTWLLLLSVLFFVPYGLVIAELGSAFAGEGGPYHWTTLAFGRVQASICAVFYWVNTPLWIGGSLAFIGAAAWNDHVFSIRPGSAGDYVFKLLFIWLVSGSAIISLTRGKWLASFGAVLRVMTLGFFAVTVAIYAIKSGLHPITVSSFRPTTGVFLGLAPLLVFNFLGFEVPSDAAEEMKNAQRDIPRAIVRGGLTSALLYGIPIAGILLVLPTKAVTGLSGFLDSVQAVFTVYGSASHTLFVVVTLCFVGTLLTSGSTWLIGGDRVLAVASYEGSFPAYFGKISARFGTPLRVNVASGIVATAFMVVATAAFHGGTDAKFAVVLNIAISTALIALLWVFPAALVLRYRRGDVVRPYRVPFGAAGMWLAGGLTTLWVVLGVVVTVAPGTVNHLLGLHYDFFATWSVSHATFNLLTFGTIAAMVAIALVGYILAWPTRREEPRQAPLDSSSAAV